MEEEAILSYLENHEEIADSGQFAAESGLDHDKVVNVIKSLHGYRYIDAQVPLLCYSLSSRPQHRFSYHACARLLLYG